MTLTSNWLGHTPCYKQGCHDSYTKLTWMRPLLQTGMPLTSNWLGHAPCYKQGCHDSHIKLTWTRPLLQTGMPWLSRQIDLDTPPVTNRDAMSLTSNWLGHAPCYKQGCNDSYIKLTWTRPPVTNRDAIKTQNNENAISGSAVCISTLVMSAWPKGLALKCQTKIRFCFSQYSRTFRDISRRVRLPKEWNTINDDLSNSHTERLKYH